MTSFIKKLRRGKYRPSAQHISGKSKIVRRALSRRREIDHGKQWFVIRTNIGCERRAEGGLRAHGFDVFRPVEDRWKVYTHRCTDVSMGWFGRYLFVGFEGAARFDLLRETDGVESILGIAGRPIAVRPEVLQAVADQIAGHHKPQSPIFSAGQTVNIAAGQFAELKAVVHEADAQTKRAIVSVEMFGKEHPVEVEFVDLRAA